MAIKRLTRKKFDLFNLARNPAVESIATESAWFADSAENVIGAILLDHADQDWNYVILGRDERGAFRWIEGESSFNTQVEAEEKLNAAMSKLEEAGQTMFAQGD